MTGLAWILLVLAGAVAAVDWWSVGAERRRVEYVGKPLTLALLIAVAVALQPIDATVRSWFVVGLAFSLAGDVFLVLRPDDLFMAGLASFLLGHLAYVAGLIQLPASPPWAAVGAVVVLAALTTVGRPILAAVRRGDHAGLTMAVAAYMAVISAMVLAAFASAVALLIVGAVLFYASDATLAWNRFVDERRWGRLAVMVTYHLGQAGLVLGLLG